MQPVRELNYIHSTATRLLLHMAMFVGPVNQIHMLIKPAVMQQEVSAFLLNHIKSNIEDLRRALCRSADDVISLMHVVINIMMEESGATVKSNNTLLRTKAIRKTWEKSFSDKVLRKVLSDVDGCLVRINNAISNDKRLGIFTTSTAIPSKYYALQRTLLRKFQKKLFKAEAKRIKAKEVAKELSSGQDTEKLIDDFAKAWDITKPSIKGFPTKFGRVMFPTEWCSLRIDQTTPLTAFLPATEGMGLCSYGMLDFLFEKQNDLLDFYVKISGRQYQPPSVNPMEVTASHLKSFDLQHDIMPIILANCQYSFEAGGGTKLEYDFEGMERQLIDRLLYSKSKIKCRPFLEIDQMMYRNELTNANVFKKLGENIPQEHLSGDVGRKIRDELRELPDACESLESIDVAISFLKTTGGDPTVKLYSFMTETLRMENAMQSQKARQCCELRHVKWLWLLLSFYKSTRIVDNRQSIEDVFETLHQEFFQDIPRDVKLAYEEYMKKLSIEVLYNWLEILHEFMLLVVGVRQNPDDEDFADTTHYPLFISLAEYITSEDSPVLDAVILKGSPDEIYYQHSTKAWLIAYETLCVKIKNRNA